MKYRYLRLLASFAVLLSACNSIKGEEESVREVQGVIAVAESKPTMVKTLILEQQTFNRELFANGKLSAIQKANLSFRGPGLVQRVFVQEGMRVQAGQIIAMQNQEQQKRDLIQSKLRYKQAQLDYKDQLLRAGYQLKDTAFLNPEILSIARLRSGLSSAELEIEKIQVENQYAVLQAPFAGKIANLKATAHNQSGAFDYICTLINDSQLEAEFQVMEQELEFVRESENIRLQSFSGDGQFYTGRITSINPLVDQSGMISVKARLYNHTGKLMDGMSVRVIIENAIPDQLVLPKEAVLDRQNRKVVFTLENSIAIWNYVDIAFENSNQFALKGLKVGDKVIYEGNFDLAHEKPVSDN